MAENNNTEERVVEAVTFGAFMLVWAAFLSLGSPNDPLALLCGGLVLLGSSVYQTRRGWHVSMTTWVLGILLTLAGLGLRAYFVTVMRINWLAIALVLIGGWWLYRAFSKRRR
jgi:hypothetical protein